MLAVDITTEKSAELVLTVNVGDSGLDTRQQIYLISWFAKDDTIGSCSFTSLQRTGKLQKRDMQQSFKYEQFLYKLYIMNRSLVVLIMYILVHHSYMPPQCIFQEYPRQSRTVDDYMGVYTPHTPLHPTLPPHAHTHSPTFPQLHYPPNTPHFHSNCQFCNTLHYIIIQLPLPMQFHF